jgi:hypothetical protein
MRQVVSGSTSLTIHARLRAWVFPLAERPSTRRLETDLRCQDIEQRGDVAAAQRGGLSRGPDVRLGSRLGRFCDSGRCSNRQVGTAEPSLASEPLKDGSRDNCDVGGEYEERCTQAHEHCGPSLKPLLLDTRDTCRG